MLPSSCAVKTSTPRLRKDFLIEGARRQRQAEEFAGIVYAHQLRVTIGQCVQDLELMAKAYESDDMVNRIEHLPLR